MSVICKICNQEFKSLITNTHLKKHDMTTAQYIEQFGKEALSSPEYRDKKSQDSMGENNPNFGNTWSDTQKTNLSEKNKGKTAWNKGISRTPAQNQHLRDKALERNKEWRENGNHPLLGRVLGEPTKTKIRLSLTGYKHTPKTITKMTKKNQKTAKKKIIQKNLNIQQFLIENDYELLSDPYDSSLHILTIKHKCEKILTRSRDSLLIKTMCHHCYGVMQSVSNKEIDLANEVQKITNAPIIVSDKTILAPFELDIYLPELKLAIEFNGIHWHSEAGGKGKWYHFQRMGL